MVLPDGTEVAVSTWKKAAATIMQDCNADARRHDTLLYLRGKVSGKLRTILSNTPEGMDVPLKIDEELFMESKFDSETLLNVLTKRVLDAVGYDYRGILLKYRESRQELAAPAEPEQAAEDWADPAPRMQM